MSSGDVEAALLDTDIDKELNDAINAGIDQEARLSAAQQLKQRVDLFLKTLKDRDAKRTADLVAMVRADNVPHPFVIEPLSINTDPRLQPFISNRESCPFEKNVNIFRFSMPYSNSVPVYVVDHLKEESVAKVTFMKINTQTGAEHWVFFARPELNCYPGLFNLYTPPGYTKTFYTHRVICRLFYHEKHSPEFNKLIGHIKDTSLEHLRVFAFYDIITETECFAAYLPGLLILPDVIWKLCPPFLLGKAEYDYKNKIVVPLPIEKRFWYKYKEYCEIFGCYTESPEPKKAKN